MSETNPHSQKNRKSSTPSTLVVCVVAGPDCGQRMELSRDTMSIGRSTENDLVLTDPTVSRKHVQIWERDRKTFVINLGTTNGVFLDGILVQRALLSVGSSFEIGETTIMLWEEKSSEADTALPSLPPEAPSSSPVTQAADPDASTQEILVPTTISVPGTSVPFKEAREAVLRDFERLYVNRLLLSRRGNVSWAAVDAKITRSYLNQIIRRIRNDHPLPNSGSEGPR